MQQKKSHGGARPGSGRKSKFKEPNIVLSFRAPESKAAHIKSVIDRWIKKNF